MISCFRKTEDRQEWRRYFKRINPLVKQKYADDNIIELFK